MAIINQSDLETRAVYREINLAHFENLLFDTLTAFVSTLTNLYDYDVNIFYADFTDPYQQNKPKIFIRFKLDENLSIFNYCTQTQIPYYNLYFTTSFENDKHILQDIVLQYENYVQNSYKSLEYNYTLGSKSSKYKSFFGSNHNQILDKTYNTENIDKYNYHTYTLNTTLNIFLYASRTI